ncbi:MAG TPA: DegT/DnrJ/EryC1/StrS family aminotransferase [Nitrososphaeraceae archaeon]|nr:DegT/DnrJ/EryC1/StrS family aminotransferase [Nitrososphaeraceae archaeon]
MKESAIHALDNEMLVGGESVLRFEDEFAKYIGTDYAVSTNSGSSALLLTFYAMGTRNGDNLIAPSATFIATINGACLLGAKPLFCEIGTDYVISLEHLEKLVNKNKVKFVVPVHLYGYPCDMFAIKDIAKKKNAVVIEDAAQAHGAKYRNKKVGCFGEAAIFSFYPSKNMTVGGDGGMVTTNNKKIYESVMKMRDVGRKTKYSHDKIGYTLRLNSVNAAIGRVQLRHLDSWNEKRRDLASRYGKKLRSVGDLILPPADCRNNTSVYHMYVIRSKKRHLLASWLLKKGISTGVHYPLPIHRQSAYAKYSKGSLPFTDEWSKTVLSLPIYPSLNSRDHEFIISMITKFYDERLYEQRELKDEAKLWSTRLI